VQAHVALAKLLPTAGPALQSGPTALQFCPCSACPGHPHAQGVLCTSPSPPPLSPALHVAYLALLTASCSNPRSIQSNRQHTADCNLWKPCSSLAHATSTCLGLGSFASLRLPCDSPRKPCSSLACAVPTPVGSLCSPFEKRETLKAWLMQSRRATGAPASACPPLPASQPTPHHHAAHLIISKDDNPCVQALQPAPQPPLTEHTCNAPQITLDTLASRGLAVFFCHTMQTVPAQRHVVYDSSTKGMRAC